MSQHGINLHASSTAPPDTLAMGLSYTVARNALQDERIDDAHPMFADLAQAAPLEPRFQFGLGLCLQHSGEINAAHRCYAIAFMLDPSDAACAYRIGECLIALGDLPAARDGLHTALALCAVPGTDPALRSLVEAQLDQLA
jgi:Flp pilus assembly protein TadD